MGGARRDGLTAKIGEQHYNWAYLPNGYFIHPVANLLYRRVLYVLKKPKYGELDAERSRRTKLPRRYNRRFCP
jgi:hypothetical protein